MASARAPLFSFSLAFAIGCVLGLDQVTSLLWACVMAGLAGLCWLGAGRREALSLAAFYLMTVAVGLAYTLLRAHSMAPEDLRRLPEAKLLTTTQWRGVIVQEPASQATAHATKRALARTTFVCQMEAWRPAEGRLFGAEIETPWREATGDLRCTLLGSASDLRVGDLIEFAAALEPVPPALSPGQFDSRDYLARQGIYFEALIQPQDWNRTASSGAWWQRLSYRARDWAYGRLQIGLEDDPATADFLAGMLIGYRQQIPRDIENDFRRTGTIHVFAVSGQNIAEMVVVALVLLQLVGLVRWRWAWVLVPVVLLYCLLTGSPASAVRATVMTLTVLAAWRFGRPLNALAFWSLAFFLMLVWNPVILLDAGAQLSFAIVLGLILLAPPLYRMMIRPVSPDPFLPRSLLTPWQRREWRAWVIFVGLIATSLAATLMSEPITAITFHQVTPISIIANLAVVPMAGLITMVGTMSVAVSLLCPPITALLNNANWLFAKILIAFVGYLAHQPGAMLNCPDLVALESTRPSLVVAPQREGASLLVRSAGETWLINAGRESASLSPVWHLLQFYGVNHLDGLVLSQMSAPDNSGAEAIVRDYSPRHLVVPVLRTKSPLEKELAEISVQADLTPQTWQQGDVVALGEGMSVEVLHPAADSTETRADDRALVLLFHVGDHTVLWAGRIGPQVQQELLESESDLHADVLVMAASPPPEESWLEALHVRDWLQIPPRDARQNEASGGNSVPALCRVWPLNRTGAVELHFAPGEILLRPWVAGPDESGP